MRHPWFVTVLLALALLTGYAVGARPAQAQAQPLPFPIGEIVTFRYADNGSRDCRVTQIRGMFALCEPAVERQSPTYGRPEPPEEWINIAVVERVTRPRDRR
jgi:hypothetical protein